MDDRMFRVLVLGGIALVGCGENQATFHPSQEQLEANDAAAGARDAKVAVVAVVDAAIDAGGGSIDVGGGALDAATTADASDEHYFVLEGPK
jgi:hypothetical protein